ncbi:hypothetical protein UFOVP45_34 [uncultured Caudovirales phage]|uniref:Uncharacterized protein n=1 Tax=uncultured Caudovirales phage TaxID=2100421 RepID=A0A6J5KN67_9CAUD|nr:hypothetical protein UFOVP45_34 [uncultured Caudovirales phage]
MPFVSKAQQAYMWAKHPDIAKDFQRATPNRKVLPQKVRIKKGKK